MEKPYHKVAGLLFGIAGLLIFILNLLLRFVVSPSGRSQFDWHNYLILLFSAILISLFFLKREMQKVSVRKKTLSLDYAKINKWIQFGVLFILANILVLNEYKNPWAFQLVFVSGMLGFKYRIITKRGLFVILLVFSLLTGYSSWTEGHLLFGLFSLVLGSLFFGTLIFLYTNELKRYFQLAQESHEKLIHTKAKLKIYEGEVLHLEDFKFANREIDVMRVLCLTHGSDQYIADNLNIKKSTVSSYLQSIFDKAGVDNRHQLIDLFRHEFIMEDKL